MTQASPGRGVGLASAAVGGLALVPRRVLAGVLERVRGRLRTVHAGEHLLPFKKGAFHMAIEAGVPIVPVCVSRYARRLNLNSWRQRTVIVRSLPPIATAGVSQRDIPALVEQCRSQMQQCIDRMEDELARR